MQAIQRKKTKPSGSSDSGAGQLKMIAMQEIKLNSTFTNLLPIAEELL